MIKEFTLTVIIALLSINCMMGQPKLLKEKVFTYFPDENNWDLRQEYIYTYEEDNLMIKRVKFKNNADEWRELTLLEQYFDENNRLDSLIELDYTTSGTRIDYALIYEIKAFEYNDNDCIVAERAYKLEDDELKNWYIKNHVSNENCEISETLVKYNSNLTDKITFSYANGQLLSDTTFNLVSGEWEVSAIRNHQYNSFGQKVSSDFLHLNSNTFLQKMWEYDDHQTLVKYSEILNSSNFPTSTRLIDSLIVTYDEQDRKKMQKKFHFGITSFDSYELNSSYSYWCNDILKEERRSQPPLSNRVVYEYSEGLAKDCLESIGNSEIQISPNPNDGIFKISSDLLGGDKTVINVFQMNGTKVFEVEVSALLFEKGVDLSFLPNGVYLLSIKNEAEIKSHKFVISK